MEQISIRAAGDQAANQAILKHIAGAPGVFADNDPGRLIAAAAALQLGIIPSQKAAHFEGMALDGVRASFRGRKD